MPPLHQDHYLNTLRSKLGFIAPLKDMDKIMNIFDEAVVEAKTVAVRETVDRCKRCVEHQRKYVFHPAFDVILEDMEALKDNK